MSSYVCTSLSVYLSSYLSKTSLYPSIHPSNPLTWPSISQSLHVSRSIYVHPPPKHHLARALPLAEPWFVRALLKGFQTAQHRACRKGSLRILRKMSRNLDPCWGLEVESNKMRTPNENTTPFVCPWLRSRWQALCSKFKRVLHFGWLSLCPALPICVCRLRSPSAFGHKVHHRLDTRTWRPLRYCLL